MLFRACRDVEDDESCSTPALRGFDPGEGYRLVSRLFQSLLKERVPPSDFTRAEKQTAVASRRIGQQVQEETQRRQAEQAKKRGPTLFDMDDLQAARTLGVEVLNPRDFLAKLQE